MPISSASMRVSCACTLALFGAAAWADTSADATSGLPLKTTRTISFTTDEATWMSLDVTPDGRTIVFDLLGDLYRLPIEGGKATRITHGLAYDSAPRVSPDGQWIAFTSDRDGIGELWIQKFDGTGLRKIAATTLKAAETGRE